MCVKIDVGSKEFRNKPDLHIAAHGSLTALIGVRGAQLTEAVFMPYGSLVVECLPFVPDDEWGGWTRFVHVPTHLGTIFIETDLNTIGLPLTISSTMHVSYVANSQEKYNKTKLCICFSLTENPWDDRDFTVPADSIMDILEKFVANGMSKNDHETPGYSSSTSNGATTLKYC